MPGNLTVEQLNDRIASGDIDTVVVAFADAQGRLVGKRVSARLFRRTVFKSGSAGSMFRLKFWRKPAG